MLVCFLLFFSLSDTVAKALLMNKNLSPTYDHKKKEIDNKMKLGTTEDVILLKHF